MKGITSIATYLPRFKMQRSVIANQLAWFDPALKSRAKGSRSVANWDEDALTMAVAAGRKLNTSQAKKLIFASTTAPFLDRSNAGLITEALTLDSNTITLESAGSQRAATSALLSELSILNIEKTLLLTGERRSGLPGSLQEMRYGDASVGLTLGEGDCVAEFIGGLSQNTDIVDHYRTAEHDIDYELEDRWVREIISGDLIPNAIKEALTSNDLTAAQLDHLVLPLPMHHSKVVAKKVGVELDKVADNLNTSIGDTGASHALLMLAKVLSEAKTGQIVCLVGVGQGVDVILLRVGKVNANEVGHAFSYYELHSQSLADYLKLPAFSQVMPLARGIRAEADKRTAMSAYYRHHKIINSMIGSRCTACDTPHFPAARVCVNCHVIDQMVDEQFSTKTATVKSFTEDWQTATPSPPMTYGNVEFSGGGNAFLEMTDVPLGTMAVGQELQMEFRIKDFDHMRGFRRYFWKPTPLVNTPKNEGK